MTNATLIEIIKQRMKREGITPYMLAQRLEGQVSRSTVYKFLNDGRPVATDTLLTILEALDATDVRITWHKDE